MIVTSPVRHVRDLPQYTTWVVADDLGKLQGPRHGWMVLPTHLWWNDDPSFNLDDPGHVYTAYRAILREAITEEDLTRYLNLDLFLRQWPSLDIPDRLRALWVDAHPVLATW